MNLSRIKETDILSLYLHISGVNCTHINHISSARTCLQNSRRSRRILPHIGRRIYRRADIFCRDIETPHIHYCFLAEDNTIGIDDVYFLAPYDCAIDLRRCIASDNVQIVISLVATIKLNYIFSSHRKILPSNYIIA